MLMAVGFRKKPVENMMSVSSDPAKHKALLHALQRAESDFLTLFIRISKLGKQSIVAYY